MSYINRNTNIPLLLLMVITFMVMTFIPNVEAGATPPPGITTLWVPVGSSTDDAEENVADGDMYLASSDLELIQDGLSQQKVGLRFTLEIPAGATIESANIQFTTDEKTSETTVLTVYGEAIAHALTFSDTDFDISNRTLTTANVPWSPLPWLTTGEAGPDQQSPNLSAIVQEVVNIAGWTQGNSIAIIIAGNGKRVAESFNGTAPPVLHVSFSTETANQAPDAVDDGTTAAPAYTTQKNQPLPIANGVDDIVERNDNLGTPLAVISTFDATSTAAGTVIVNPDGSFSYTPASGFVGVDSFTYTLENTEGSDSATVYIQVVDDIDVTTLWIPVITASDDAEEDISDGIVRLTSSDLELIQDGSTEQLVGVRFQDLNIPHGAIITEAYIQYTADEDDSEATSLTIYAEASGNALTFSSLLFDISDRRLTTAFVTWIPDPWNTNEQTSRIQATPDLATIVQEIVNRADWLSGNAIAFITTGSGKRVAESFNGTAAPVLHLSFTTESPVNQPPDAIDDNVAGIPAYSTNVNQQLTVSNGPADIVERNDDVGFPIATVSTFTQVSTEGGTVIVSPDGSFSYTPALDFEGVDSFNYTLQNSEGSDTATVTLEVVNPDDFTPLWIPVITGSDDAEEDIADGDMDLSSSDLEMTLDRASVQLVGVRFQGVNVPPGATIEQAAIQYTVDEDTTEQTVLTIHGELSEDAQTFNDTDHNITQRTRTTASKQWIPPAWNIRGVAGPDQQTPDLSEIVQELVNQSGWAEGNAMVFITTGSGNRVAESFNGSAPPELHLVYSIPQSGNLAPTATSVTITDTDGAPLVIGHHLTGTYVYHDVENDAEGNSIFHWLREGTPIAGATSETYTTVAADAGKTLTFEVTPVASRGTSPGIAASSADVTVNFQIGDRGPAGGIVFYISDNDGTYGLNGLEAAPEDQDQDLGLVPWGCYGLLIAGADGTAVSTGAQNTADILSGCTEAGIVAEIVDKYILNDFNDWFLPSIDTLNLMYELRAIIGNFASNTSYWSSSEINSNSAWDKNFRDGVQRSTSKSAAHLNVRAVRAIPVTSPPNSRPMAINVSITDDNEGLLIVGDSLTGNYTYSDAESDNEGASTFRWLRDGVAITGAINTSYTTVAADERKVISFEVTPIAVSGTSPGTSIASPAVFVYLQIAENEFQLGGIGPAGGTVVYISDGDGFVGTQGLEIAPEDQDKAPWGCKFLLIAGADDDAIGTGAQNTSDILAGCSESGIAAEIATQYSLNGYTDWFLPSKSELFLVAEPDRRPYLPNLNIDRDLYWTSTEADEEFAWVLGIPSGSEEGDWTKDHLFNVRAMRAFPAASPPNSRPNVTSVSITDDNGGVLIVGDSLTGNYTYNDPENDIEGESIVRWLRNGIAISGATTTSYTTVAADIRNRLTFEITPVATNGSTPGTTVISSDVVVLLQIADTDFQIGGLGPAGGIVFYISDGDGVVGTQGLEVAPEDQGSAEWGCIYSLLVGADGTAVGTGVQNTADILAGCSEAGIAAELADNFILNGFDDWFLASKDELNLLNAQKFAIAGLDLERAYWSSSEFDEADAWYQGFWPTGTQRTISKRIDLNVRAIRSFSGESPTPEYQIGDTGPAGGIVFYISDGDGFTGTHGLEAAPEDQDVVPWGCYGSPITGADGTAVGTGAQNTADILADCGDAGIAAEVAEMYSLNGFSDWFLPSKDALLLLYEQRAIVENFGSTYYWSSKENSDYSAWYQSFGSGSQRTGNKNVLYGVRAIRYF